MALSGGLDSMVLLHACVAQGMAPLTAIHVHHGLHPEAESWARLCLREAERLGVPCMRHDVVVEPTGRGLEAAAREARYRVFEEVLAPGHCLLMAHHQDDQLETVLLRLFKGAQPEDLMGMPISRGLGAGTLYRPFLHLPRAVLRVWARHRAVHWVEDPSNRDTVFDRNFIRHDILPRLTGRWPDLNRRLTALQARMRQRLQAADSAARDVLTAMQADTVLPLDVWSRLSPDMQNSTLKCWLSERAGQQVPESTLAEFIRELHAGQAARLHLKAGMAARYRHDLYWVPAQVMTAKQEPIDLHLVAGEDTVLSLATGRLTLRWVSRGAWLAAPPPEGLTIRGRQQGDRLPSRHQEGKPLKDSFQANGIPPWLRDAWPLLCSGSRVLALGDRWLDTLPEPETAGWRIDWVPDQAFFCNPNAQGSKSRSH